MRGSGKKEKKEKVNCSSFLCIGSTICEHLSSSNESILCKKYQYTFKVVFENSKIILFKIVDDNFENRGMLQLNNNRVFTRPIIARINTPIGLCIRDDDRFRKPYINFLKKVHYTGYEAAHNKLLSYKFNIK